MGKEHSITHTAKGCKPEERLSDYVVGKFSELPSRKSVKKALKKGLFRLNGKPTKSGDYVVDGDLILLKLEPKPVFEFEIPVLFEDDFIAVVDKPAGMIVSGNTFRTVEHALPFNLKDTPSQDALLQPMPAHRLDFPTRGILLVAKTKSALNKLKEAFAATSIQKTYHALTIGEMEEKGTVSNLIDGKNSVSHFEIIGFKNSGKYGKINLVRVKPITGRKHQIRKHLAHLGHPILGDQDYGSEEHLQMHKGLYLHATEIQFDHPITGEPLKFELPLPKKFTKLIKI